MNRESILHQVAQMYPHLLTTNTFQSCAEFCARAALRLRETHPAEGWGLLSKDAGEHGYTWPTGVRTSHDVLALPTGERFDILVGAAARSHPDPREHKDASVGWDEIPRSHWRPHNAWTSVDDVWRPGPSSPARTRLGCSLFWLLAGVARFPVQLDRNLAWIRDELGADYVRAMGFVQGDLYQGVDPWEFAGETPTVPLVRRAMDICRAYGLKVQWTIVGGRAGRSLSQLEQLFDLFAVACEPRLEDVELFEACNEYAMSEKMTPSELRHCARRLRACLPAGFPIALSSPHGVHNEWTVADVHAEVERLYGGDSGANAITPHWGRPADTRWNPGADLGPHAPRAVYSNEPRGPGASGVSVDDPHVILDDFRASQRAGERGYVFHALAGIWGGHCHPRWPDQNRYANLDEHPTAAAIASALRAARGSAPAPGPAPRPVPLPPEVEVPKPYPSEQEFWPAYVADVVALYKQAGQTEMAEIIERDPLAFVWFARMGHSSAHDDLVRAREKHLRELAEALGVAP